jgi:hypothetical protein
MTSHDVASNICQALLEGFDKRAMDDGYVSVSVFGVCPVAMPVGGERGAVGYRDMASVMAMFEETHCE